MKTNSGERVAYLVNADGAVHLVVDGVLCGTVKPDEEAGAASALAALDCRVVRLNLGGESPAAPALLSSGAAGDGERVARMCALAEAELARYGAAPPRLRELVVGVIRDEEGEASSVVQALHEMAVHLQAVEHVLSTET